MNRTPAYSISSVCHATALEFPCLGSTKCCLPGGDYTSRYLISHIVSAFAQYHTWTFKLKLCMCYDVLKLRMALEKGFPQEYLPVEL